MAINLTCLTNYPPLPIIPQIANLSNSISHSAYKPGSGGISQMISASIARSAFSTKDVESLLSDILNDKFDIFDVSQVTQIKPVTSIIVYTSVALALFLIFSIMFCICSCLNSDKRRKKSKTTNVCVCLLVIVFLLAIGDMIYVVYRVNKSKISVEDAIKEFNEDIYPKDVSEHVKYLMRQIETLDQYSVQNNSIIINASKSMLVKAFNGILEEKYFINDINQALGNFDKNIKKLNNLVGNLSTTAQQIFEDIQNEYQSIIVYIRNPMEEVCMYANGTHNNIDAKLLDALNDVHKNLEKIINTMKNDILSQMTPPEAHLLISSELEEEIRRYTQIAGNVLLAIVLILGVIPMGFFIIIFMCRLCCKKGSSSNNDSYDGFQMKDMVESSFSDRYVQRRQPSNGRSSGVAVCLMRTGFLFLMIILLILILVTSAYYAIDLFLQGVCRTVHEDQPYLINLLSDKFIDLDDFFINRTEFSTAVTNLLDDCRDQIHFSRRYFKSFWPYLSTHLTDMMNTLSEQIYAEFNKSIGEINVPSEINLLIDFLNQTNVPIISDIVQDMENNLNTIQINFENIQSSNPTLSQNLTNSTIHEFENFTQEVIEKTIDICPLPLNLIYKADTLICHTTGGSFSGLWLSLFIFMILVIVGLCIFGAVVYKRLNQPSQSTSSEPMSF